MALTNPFLLSLFPSEERLIPSHNATPDGWIDSDPTLFKSQWIDCTYPISGGYGRGPRYLFYFLVAFALIERRQTWIAGTALALVMAYSGAAAIHALALVAIRKDLVPKYMTDNYEVVLVGGSSQNGSFAQSTPDNWRTVGLWLPLLPGAWDADCDAVLAIVGVAFLVVAPMQIWSTTYRALKKKIILLLWSLLLFVGMICALVNEAYVTFYSFPQLRFCPLDLNDTLPLTNGVSDSIGGTWDRKDWYRWNRTITEFFESNGASKNPTNCIYPCFGTSWRLRDPTDIVATEPVAALDSTAAWWLIFAVYVVVFSAGLSSLIIFVIKEVRERRPKWLQRIPKWLQRSKNRSEFIDKCKNAWARPIFTITKLGDISKLVIDVVLYSVDIWAIALGPISIIFFIVYVEWIMWWDQQGESFLHVGQWGPLVGAALTYIAALVDHYEGDRTSNLAQKNGMENEYELGEQA